MKAVFSPGPSYSDPQAREHAGWVTALDVQKEGLEELGYEVFIPKVDSSFIDQSCTVSKILSYDVTASYECRKHSLIENVDLFVGPLGYSLSQMISLRKAKKLAWLGSNADWFRDQQLVEEYKKFDFPYDMSPAWREINRMALEVCDRAFSTTFHIKETHAKMASREKISVVPLGVDSERFSPLGEEPPGFRILFSGTNPILKGLVYLLEAIRGMEGIEVWIVGPGPLTNPPSYIRQFDVVPYSEVADIYRQCHVFCMPTLDDGFNLALHEAMACGLVPITTPVLAEAFEHKKSGLVVEYRDIVGIRASLRFLQEEPDIRRRMGAEARLLAKERTWGESKRRFKELIEEMI